MLYIILRMKKITPNLEPAINHFGSLAAIARAIGYKPMAASQWKRRKSLSAELAVEIALKSNGAIKPSDLLPGFKWW